MAEQWEYREEVILNGTDRTAILNRLGTEGWEVVSMEPNYGEFYWATETNPRYPFVSNPTIQVLKQAETGVKVLFKRRKP